MKSKSHAADIGHQTGLYLALGAKSRPHEHVCCYISHDEVNRLVGWSRVCGWRG